MQKVSKTDPDMHIVSLSTRYTKTTKLYW